MNTVNSITTVKVMTALGLAIAICALAFLLNPALVQSRPEELVLPEEYAISAAIGRDQPAFHARSGPDSVRATNAPQALTVDFTTDSVTIRSGQARWAWRLDAYGYGSTLVPVAPAEPVVTANRVEYRRGPLAEWYVNGPLGVQQGFDLVKPPASARTGEPLSLVGTFSGSGQVELAGERSLSLVDAAGQAILNYTGLLVYDAAGQKLPVWLELNAGQLSLRIDDHKAIYPIHIDPWFQKARLTASDGLSFERFGNSVAISGHTAVIGARRARVNGNNSQGAVYVFEKPGGTKSIGRWDSNLTELAKLTAADGAKGDLFGFAVDSDGEVIVATATTYNDYHGAAYVFIRPPGGWVTTSTYTAKLTATDATSGEGFGWSTGISGDTIVVGAQDDDGRGAAYVFVKPESGWSGNLTETAKLTAADPQASRFGAAVDISGDTIIVGAYSTRVGSNGNQGAAYVFVKPESGWSGHLTETARLVADDGGPNDWFADSVAISNNTVVIGARYGNNGFGAAYIYEQPPAGWVTTSTATARLSASDVISYGLGQSVAIDGDAVVVGAVFSDPKLTNSNSAYVFDRPAGGWVTTSTFTVRLTPLEGMPFDSFGHAVAISGRTIVVGADETDIGDNYSQGAAYIYELQPDLIVHETVTPTMTTPGQTVTYTLEFSNTGSTIATDTVLTDVIPGEIEIQDISSSGAVITNVAPAGLVTPESSTVNGASSPNLLNWSVQNLLPNQGGTIVVTGRLSLALPPGLLTATTVITSPTDTNPVNNMRTTTLMVSSPESFPTYLPLIMKNY